MKDQDRKAAGRPNIRKRSDTRLRKKLKENNYTRVDHKTGGRINHKEKAE